MIHTMAQHATKVRTARMLPLPLATAVHSLRGEAFRSYGGTVRLGGVARR